MKKILFALLFFFTLKLSAQNLQVHYDFGKDREYITTTLEMFKPDEYGATFFFVDFDFNMTGNNSLSLAYWEIARYVNVYEKLAVTLQYNDGLTSVPVANLGNIAVTLNQTFLAGLSYPIDLGFVTLNTDVLYRSTYGSDSPDGQLTCSWFVPFLDGKITFSGFMDLWTEDEAIRAGNSLLSDKKEVVFLTEPQIWYNPINHLSIGTEIEISNNFLPFQNEVKVMPTLALKWTF